MIKSIFLKSIFLIKSNYFLYGIIQKFKGNSDIFPSNKTDITIEGFGRSGNTFLVKILENLDSNLKIAHHTHSYASVKKSVNLNIPTFILIRKPEQAISSAIIKNSKYIVSDFVENSKYLTYSYYEFYKNINLLKGKIEIIKFEDLIVNTQKYMNLILNKVEKSYTEIEINNAINKTLLDLKNDNRDITKRQLGGEERDKLKADFIKIIINDNYFKKIYKIYNIIINDSI